MSAASSWILTDHKYLLRENGINQQTQLVETIYHFTSER